MGAESGFYLLKTFEDVLYVRSFGYWDDRTARAFAGELQELIPEALGERPWCTIHDARQWLLGIPAVEGIISEFVSSPLTGNLTHHALITGPSELKKWQVNRMFCDITAYEHRRFDGIEQGREWLMAAGYAIPDLNG